MATEIDDTLPLSGESQPPSARSLAIGAQAAGRYRITRLLGAGGMGEVYAAEDLIVGGAVALKTLLPELASSATAIERFRREIALARKVTNPQICRLHDVGTHEGRLFITMELLEGPTLADRVRTDGTLPLDEVDRIARLLVDGLAALHAAGIVHRDFKTSNVILVGDRTVITDFGLARSTVEGDAMLTAEGGLLGTPAYMAPEQVDGRPATAASDIYALGIVLFELVTGKLPFREDTVMATATARLKQDAPLASSLRPDLPARWDATIARCLAREPAQRPARVEDVLDAAPIRRPSRAWIAPVAVGVVALAGAVFALTREDPKSAVAPVASVSCPAAMDKLVGAWDSTIRARGAARFAAVKRPDVDATWRVLANELDRYAQRWGTQWTAACAAPDRTTDQLLYAQRLTCLDNAVIALQGVSESAIESEPVLYSEGYVGSSLLPALDDCESTPVLRAQSPAPTPDKRDEVVRLMISVQRAGVDLRASAGNASRRDVLEGALARLEVAAKALDKLDVPEAAIAWYWVGHYFIAIDRIDAARDAIAKSIRRARDLRNDQWLVTALTRQLHLAWRVDDTVTYDAALAELGEAIERAGKPLRGRVDFLAWRAKILMLRGQNDRALADVEAARPLRERLEIGDRRGGTEQLIDVYRRTDRLHDAVALARHLLDDTIALWGRGHRQVFGAHFHLMSVLIQTGDHSAARPQVEAAIAIATRVGGETNILHLRAALLAWIDKDLPGASAHLDASRGPKARTESYLDFIESFTGEGSIGALRWAGDYLRRHLDELPTDRRRRVWAQLAWIEMIAGDIPAMRAAVAQRPADGGDSWVSVVIDALEGHPARSRSNLATSKLDGSELNWARAVIAMAERSWPEVIAALDEARKPLQDHGLVWNYLSDYADIYGFLGHAYVAASDPMRALGLLEQALHRSVVCCHGTHYVTPIAQLALARALWDTGGDKVRARRLAEHARAGFARLGKGRETDRQAAIRWLAEHPI